MNPSREPPAYGLLACDVFADELAALGGNPPPWRGFTSLEMGLHDHPERLRREVQAAIERLEETPGLEYVVLAYGLCGNGLLGVRAGRLPLVLPRAHDCIAILLGGQAEREHLMRDMPGGYFYSPGWIRGGRVPGPDRDAFLCDLYRERYLDDPELVADLLAADRETFASYHTALYVDVTGDTAAENHCRECARAMGWDFRRLRGKSGWLRALLAGQWDDECFLTVPPGACVSLEHDQFVARTEP